MSRLRLAKKNPNFIFWSQFRQKEFCEVNLDRRDKKGRFWAEIQQICIFVCNTKKEYLYKIYLSSDHSNGQIISPSLLFPVRTSLSERWIYSVLLSVIFSNREVSYEENLEHPTCTISVHHIWSYAGNLSYAGIHICHDTLVKQR